MHLNVPRNYCLYKDFRTSYARRCTQIGPSKLNLIGLGRYWEETETDQFDPVASAEIGSDLSP